MIAVEPLRMYRCWVCQQAFIESKGELDPPDRICGGCLLRRLDEAAQRREAS